MYGTINVVGAPVIPVPVVIVVPPTSGTNCPGGTTTFSVTATGTALTYQWTFNGVVIPGVTNRTLAVRNITATNAGTYCSIVSGATVNLESGMTVAEFANLNFQGGEAVLNSTLTNGGTLTGNDSHIGLYNAAGTFLASNDDDGPGAYSRLSFGDTAPARAGTAGTGNATTTGLTYAGANGAELQRLGLDHAQPLARRH